MTPKEQEEAAQRYCEATADEARADFETLLKRHPESGLGHEQDDRLLVMLLVGIRVADAIGDIPGP